MLPWVGLPGGRASDRSYNTDIYPKPGGSDGKDSACKCRRHNRQGFDPWVGKLPWRRAWQPTPVFLPGESHGQGSLEGYTVHQVAEAT